MIIEDITFSDTELKTDVNCDIVLVQLVPVQAQVLKAIKLFLEAYESNEWLRMATVRVLSDLYIREADIQIEKAKKVLKEKPNNLKTKIKWLLKLK